MRLLQKLAPYINTTNLRSMHWDSAGSDVYVPLWRRQTAQFEAVLAHRTVVALPEVVRDFPEIAKRIPDAPGTLLTREQRLGHALEALRSALTLALVDGGWHLQLQPGQLYVEREGVKLESASIVSSLQSGKLTADTWVEFCHKNGVDNWPLLSIAMPGAIS